MFENVVVGDTHVVIKTRRLLLLHHRVLHKPVVIQRRFLCLKQEWVILCVREARVLKVCVGDVGIKAIKLHQVMILVIAELIGTRCRECVKDARMMFIVCVGDFVVKTTEILLQHQVIGALIIHRWRELARKQGLSLILVVMLAQRRRWC